MEKKLFTESMAYLATLYGKAMEPGVLQLYWMVVKGWENDQWEKSVAEVIGKFKPTAQCPFPVPADFVGASGGSIDDRATTAVNRLISYLEKTGSYADMDTGDPILHATVQRFGGISEVSKWTYEDWKFMGKQFKETYRAMTLSGEEGVKLVAGINSIVNQCLESRQQQALEDCSGEIERLIHKGE
jgi:hypothetical protein